MKCFQKLIPRLKNWLKLLFNWRFWLCFGLGWMITNGWSYILLCLGVLWDLEWMKWLSGAYLTFLWRPVSPEKLVTVAIAVFFAHRLFPAHTAALVEQIRQLAPKKKKRRSKGERMNMNMNYRLAIFDLDGTILDTLEDLYLSINASLASSNFPARTRDEVKSFIGNGVPKLIERSAPAGATEAQKEKLYADFTAHYALHCADNTRPYEGIPELLGRLKDAGVLLAVVSNKDDYAVKDLCRQYFDGYFQAAVGGKADVRKKPAPDTVNEVLASLGVRAEEAVYIGDTGVDIETARNAGMDCISVSWGFRDLAHLKANGATCILDRAEEIFEKIKK